MIITNSDLDLEDIFDVRDSLDTEDLESFLDSRLDVESVLIDDIKLETDMMVYCSDSQSSGGSGDSQLLTSQQIKGKYCFYWGRTGVLIYKVPGSFE